MNLDRLRQVLPDLDELRPLWERAAERSVPDPGRAWSGSGELGTLGSRLVDPAEIQEAVGDLVAARGRRLERLYRAVGDALAHLDAGRHESAAAALLDAAALEESAERHERAEAYALAAHEVVKDLRDRKPAALALRRAARAARSRGRLGEAATRYREAHRMARDSFDERGAAEAAVGMGNVLERQGRWDRAEIWYRRALEAVEDQEGAVSERWHALLNIHITLRSRGRVDESVPWLERAEEEADALGDPAAATYLANARGQLRMASGEFAAAEDELRRALDRARSAEAAVVVQLNLAEALLAQGRALEAAEEAREAERSALMKGVFPRLPEAYRLLGRIAATEGDSDAFVFFERALEIIGDRGLPDLERAVTLQAYSELERERGNEETASELRSAAADHYRELGIEHARDPWSDTYGPQSRGDRNEANEERDDDG